MPPPPGIAGAAFFFGASATMASVVIMRPAIEAASCSATRTTFAGSTMPAPNMSTYCSVCASKPKLWDLLAKTLPTTIEPSTPEFSAICRIGASRALSTILMPDWTPAFSSLSLPIAGSVRANSGPACGRASFRP